MRYSIKPGRGPSAGGAIGGVIVAGFGILWTIFALSITADAPFPINVIFPGFGVLFVVMAVVGIFFNVRNAAGKNRFSTYEIMPSSDEPEPLFGGRQEADSNPYAGRQAARYCSQCGAGLESGDRFCSKCGSKVKG